MFGILGDDIGSYNMVDELDYENMQLNFYLLINSSTMVDQLAYGYKSFTNQTFH